MAQVTLEIIRSRLGEVRKAVASMEKLLNKGTPFDVRTDAQMHLDKAKQELEWATESLRRSEIFETKVYVPGGE